mmetsp:Transcript_26737/g.29802  ORF Transcript_26737/g.29802 Transcript_26737/m.29802 type:complete len:294 (+) Transcript_26737:44-925(+)
MIIWNPLKSLHRRCKYAQVIPTYGNHSRGNNEWKIVLRRYTVARKPPAYQTSSRQPQALDTLERAEPASAPVPSYLVRDQTTGCLTSESNRRAKLNDMACDLGIKTREQWRSVTWKMIRDLGGGTLINWHQGSLGKTLADLLDDESLLRYGDRFKNRRPRGYWQDPKNQFDFFQNASTTLNITRLDNWTRVAHWQLKALGGAGILPYLPNALNVVDSRFSSPEENHQQSNQLSRKAMQMSMLNKVQKIFPDLRVVEEHVINTRMAGTPLTVDVFVPELNIAFEYQGTNKVLFL